MAATGERKEQGIGSRKQGGMGNTTSLWPNEQEESVSTLWRRQKLTADIQWKGLVSHATSKDIALPVSLLLRCHKNLVPSLPQKPQPKSCHIRNTVWDVVPVLCNSWNAINFPTLKNGYSSEGHHPHYLEALVSVISLSSIKVSVPPNRRLINSMIFRETPFLIGASLIQMERISSPFPFYQRDTRI